MNNQVSYAWRENTFLIKTIHLFLYIFLSNELYMFKCCASLFYGVCLHTMF